MVTLPKTLNGATAKLAATLEATTKVIIPQVPPINRRLLFIGKHFDGFAPNGNGYKALCPAHDDNNPSLSIAEGDNGKVLIHCHAGCSPKHILETVGLRYADLDPACPIIVATYDYRDEFGELLYQSVRKDPKDFRQRAPDGNGGWHWSTKDVRKVLYRLPELLAADPNQPVFIVEGEKDADRLVSLGLVATCNVGGAGKWLDEYGEVLIGRHVVIIGDNDDAGREHAEQVASSTYGKATSVKVPTLPGLSLKGDVSDWLNAGGTAEKLLELASLTPIRVQNAAECNGQNLNGSANGKPINDYHLPVPKRNSLLDSADRIAMIEQDIEDMGLVGSRDNALLVYCAFSSRKREKPVSIIIRGVSGSGKDKLQDTVAALMPPECKTEKIMQYTEASLFNHEKEDYYKHKILIMGERNHSTDDKAKDAGKCLRQLLSNGRMSREVNVKDKNGVWITTLQTLEGPVVYSETTTSESIFEEDLSRVVQVYTDDSEQQSLAVKRAMGNRYDPNWTKPDTEAIIERHHEFQRYLQELPEFRVAIPYHGALAELMPKGTKTNRAMERVMTVIECIVLLMYDRREEKNGWRIATLDDYAVARRLLVGPLHKECGVGKHYENALKLMNAKTKDCLTFNTEQAKKILKHGSTASITLEAMVAAGVIQKTKEAVSGPNGGPAQYTWVDGYEIRFDSMVLPSVEKVKEFVNSLIQI